MTNTLERQELDEMSSMAFDRVLGAESKYESVHEILICICVKSFLKLAGTTVYWD